MSNIPTVFWWYGALGVGVMILVAAFLIIATGKEPRADRRRKVDLAAAAARIHADYLPDDQSVLQWFKGTPFHPYSRRAAATGVMRGQVCEAHAIFFDLDVETALDADTSVHYKQTVAMFHFGEGGMPAFSLERRGDDALADDFTGPGAKPLVELPGNPAFSSKFRLTGDDAEAIRTLFTAKLCVFIDANADWAVESTGAWIAVCRKRVRPDIDAYHAFVGEAAEFRRAFGTRG